MPVPPSEEGVAGDDERLLVLANAGPSKGSRPRKDTSPRSRKPRVTSFGVYQFDQVVDETGTGTRGEGALSRSARQAIRSHPAYHAAREDALCCPQVQPPSTDRSDRLRSSAGTA